ncbi:hypothetical protein AYK26_03580 [Euryarchaeota archaeon SM23-78]|nr:MAG: hypothetical protein AYK26_03580 [Euryarchaeota archaeon SM23-78]MBW3000546.1 hypothetical protein [Candidatus Woesearchaeota archaeon]
MVNKEEILKIVQIRGPLIPNELKKIIKAGDTLLLGAVLAELKTEGKVKVTHTKVGSTPAYYTIGTEVRLQNLMKYLNEKDRRTAELLRQKKILKDSDLSPLVRVSLRSIRDFAKPLEVSVKGQREIYWKWYMVPIREAEQMIMQKIKPVPKMPIREEVKKVEVKKLEEKKEEIKEIKKEPLVLAHPELAREKEEVQKELGMPAEELEKEKDAFFRKVWNYCKQNDIEVIEYKIKRKKSDIEYTLAVPSRIGSQEYYCKARKKKKINDGDLSSAYVQGQAKKLPVIFITTGELTKKAKDMLAKDFKGMIVKKI